jgi:aspartate kinase
MSTLVMKFGGAAVASPAHFAKVAEIILIRALRYPRIAVVVSAMGNTTDSLLKLAKEVHPYPPKREQDMLISVGERISIALLAMALSLKDREAISFTGSQSGIITDSSHTDARILEMRPLRLLGSLNQGKIVIVAGFQGMSRTGEITTLGRGGSDTSAVALGIALKADKVEFFKDVAGIFDVDPKVEKSASFFPHLTYREALAIVQKGAKVLHPRAVLLAEKNNLPLHVLSFNDPESLQMPGTFIAEDKIGRREQCIYEGGEE